MTITVSKITETKSASKAKKNRPVRRVNFEMATVRQVERCFKDIGYRRFYRTDGKVQFDSEYSDMPSLTFGNIYEAKGWLIQAGAWKEAK